jgi:hypothetical protein
MQQSLQVDKDVRVLVQCEFKVLVDKSRVTVSKERN